VLLLLCDIDHFKQINDVHGHLVGDEVLEGVSTRLRNAVRAHDAVGRYGGEEFLIILNRCAGDGLLSCRKSTESDQPFPFLRDKWADPRIFERRGNRHRELGQVASS
jgi:GGDEF domain-containing protein